MGEDEDRRARSGTGSIPGRPDESAGPGLEPVPKVAGLYHHGHPLSIWSDWA